MKENEYPFVEFHAESPSHKCWGGWELWGSENGLPSIFKENTSFDVKVMGSEYKLNSESSKKPPFGL